MDNLLILAQSDGAVAGGIFGLLFLVFLPGLFTLAWMVDIWWRTVKNEKNTRKLVALREEQNNILKNMTRG